MNKKFWAFLALFEFMTVLICGGPLEAYENHLSKEKSPYLLQHAKNPVDWYPWGPEAFEKARREDKPIFLSIGYSTCHWCHVMAHESFENPDTAKILNDHFISIKVDREERPDIDNIYMSYVSAVTGSGGWPMSVFLTPEKKPFYGGTYFPPDNRWGMPGFPALLGSIAESWKSRREDILKSADSAVNFLSAQALTDTSGDLPGPKILDEAYRRQAAAYDKENGGFGHAPKFPRSHALTFLLRYSFRKNQPKALRMTEETLQAMARGGLYDQLGGGFHRYSTDAKWRIPHFEKMLYDQALLVQTYTEAFWATGKKDYEKVVRETLDYVLFRMTSPDGAFYSAEDADSADPENPSHKSEGAFFLWKKSEIYSALDARTAELFCAAYGVEEAGNALSDPHGEFQQKNVLYQALTTEELATRFSMKPEEIEKNLLASKEKLFQIRERRPKPHLDDKVLTDWNALMISAFARASVVLNEPRYEKAAVKAAHFLLQNLRDSKGAWLHRYRDKEAVVSAPLGDHAFLIEAFLDLNEADHDPAWLEEARRTADEMIARFQDEEHGGFYFTADGGEELILRSKEFYDGALPSGNSAAAYALVHLGQITGEDRYTEAAERTIRAVAALLTADPSNVPVLLSALDILLGPSREVVIVPSHKGDEAEFIKEIRKVYFPWQVVLVKSSGQDKKAIPGKTAVYVCQNKTCRLPVTDVKELKKVLDSITPNRG